MTWIETALVLMSALMLCHVTPIIVEAWKAATERRKAWSKWKKK